MGTEPKLPFVVFIEETARTITNLFRVAQGFEPREVIREAYRPEPVPVLLDTERQHAIDEQGPLDRDWLELLADAPSFGRNGRSD